MTRKSRPKIVEHTPKYIVGQVVYAIAFSNDSVHNRTQAETKDEWDRDFARIYKVIIDHIGIDTRGVSYGVKDYIDYKDWGDTVLAEQVSDDKNELFEYLTVRWRL